MAEVKWIKLSSELFDNRKIKQIRKMPDGDAIIVIWFQILCLAGNQGSKGLVFFSNDIPYTDEMLAVEFDRNINTIRLAIQTFIRFGMIEITNDFILISNWERYQSSDKIESIREYNREKKREQRTKQKQALLEISQGQCQGQVIDCQDIDIISNSLYSLSSSLKENNNKDEVKQKKHKYGTYKNVLLTDEECERLKLDYPRLDFNKLIEWFSAYIEEKGYKSKSHNLAIRRWVIDAYNEPISKTKKYGRVEKVSDYSIKTQDNLTKEDEERIKKDFEDLKESLSRL